MGVCLRSLWLAPGRLFRKAKTQAEAKENSCVTPCAMQCFFDETKHKGTYKKMENVWGLVSGKDADFIKYIQDGLPKQGE